MQEGKGSFQDAVPLILRHSAKAGQMGQALEVSASLCSYKVIKADTAVYTVGIWSQRGTSTDQVSTVASAFPV